MRSIDVGYDSQLAEKKIRQYDWYCVRFLLRFLPARYALLKGYTILTKYNVVKREENLFFVYLFLNNSLLSLECRYGLFDFFSRINAQIILSF